MWQGVRVHDHFLDVGSVLRDCRLGHVSHWLVPPHACLCNRQWMCNTTAVHVSHARVFLCAHHGNTTAVHVSHTRVFLCAHHATAAAVKVCRFASSSSHLFVHFSALFDDAAVTCSAVWNEITRDTAGEACIRTCPTPRAHLAAATHKFSELATPLLPPALPLPSCQSSRV